MRLFASHPFEHWPRRHRRALLVVGLVLAVLPVVLDPIVDPLHSDVHGESIIDFELAG
jgi:hypothetical protein